MIGHANRKAQRRVERKKDKKEGRSFLDNRERKTSTKKRERVERPGLGGRKQEEGEHKEERDEIHETGHQVLTHTQEGLMRARGSHLIDATNVTTTTKHFAD